MPLPRGSGRDSQTTYKVPKPLQGSLTKCSCGYHSQDVPYKSLVAQLGHENPKFKYLPSLKEFKRSTHLHIYQAIY